MLTESEKRHLRMRDVQEQLDPIALNNLWYKGMVAMWEGVRPYFSTPDNPESRPSEEWMVYKENVPEGVYTQTGQSRIHHTFLPFTHPKTGKREIIQGTEQVPDWRVVVYDDSKVDRPSWQTEPLVRIHSTCRQSEFLALVFGNPDTPREHCDCQHQRVTAMEEMDKEGGVFIWLNQEGRGAGIFAKGMAVHLEQEYGFTTEQAYEHLGLPFDQRTYYQAIEILEHTLPKNIDRIHHLSGNMDKTGALELLGVPVVRKELDIKPAEGKAAEELRIKQQRGYTIPENRFS